MFWFVCMSCLFSTVWYKKDITSNCLIVLFEHFPVVLLWRKIYFFPIILINKRFNFRYSLRGFLQGFDNFMQQLKQTENNYHHYFLDLLLPFCFSTIQVNLYVIHLFSNLFFEGGNTINQYYRKQIRLFSLILLNLFDNFVKEIQKVFRR